MALAARVAKFPDPAAKAAAVAAVGVEARAATLVSSVMEAPAVTRTLSPTRTFLVPKAELRVYPVLAANEFVVRTILFAADPRVADDVSLAYRAHSSST